MTRHYYDFIQEIDDILEKKAAAEQQGRFAADAAFAVKTAAAQQLGTTETEGGSSTAMQSSTTKGGGKEGNIESGSPVGKDKDDADKAPMGHPQHGDHSSQGETTAYRDSAKETGGGSGTVSSNNDGSRVATAAELGNDVLNIINRLSGGQRDKSAAGAALADQVLRRLLSKQAEDGEDYEGEGEEGGVPAELIDDAPPGGGGEEEFEMTEEEESEAEDAGKKTDEEKKAFVMSKRAGEHLAEVFFNTMGQVEQARMQKAAGYQAAEQILKQAQFEQEQAQQFAIQAQVEQAMQEKIAMAQFEQELALRQQQEDAELVREIQKRASHQQKRAAAPKSPYPGYVWAGNQWVPEGYYKQAGVTPPFPAESARVEPHTGNGSTDLLKAAEAGASDAQAMIDLIARDWLSKNAGADGGTGMLHSILAGLVGDKTISPEERDEVFERLTMYGSGGMDESSIAKATEGIVNKEAVREALVKILLQHNDTPAPSPEPAMPLTQTSPSTSHATMAGSVSQTENPGGMDKVVAAALRRAAGGLGW